ncbi:NADP-dependent oxidoreductase [Streptomyces sioyaensis]|uniref:NADP-dependent oxidoreductase n=1 Tax=Streptomyces sioyaensis TaxID=67364 RepID=UPI0037AC470A
MSTATSQQTTTEQTATAPTATATMRAISQDVLGGPEVLQEVEVARPEPGPSEVLVRVHAAGVNPTDWKHREQGVFLGQPPFVLGWDVSGVVEAVGTGVTLFKPGDEVFGMLPYPYGVGSHAEYVTGPARAFARKPATIDHVQAGALPLAALTAWQALVDTAAIRAGDRVLIHAAAGGVGHLAVQIAKARGAYVIGTASAAKHAFVRDLGADEVVDYQQADFAEVVHDVDVVLDTIGGEYQLRSLRTLRRGGLLVSILPFPAQGLAEEADRLGMRTELLLVEADHTGMKVIAELAEGGALRAAIAGTFPMAQAVQAHELGETNRTTGKLVLVMGATSGAGD